MRGHISHILKMHYAFKKTFSLLPGIDQTNKYIVMLTKELENQKKIYHAKKQLKNNRDKIFVTEDLTNSVRYYSS